MSKNTDHIFIKETSDHLLILKPTAEENESTEIIVLQNTYKGRYLININVMTRSAPEDQLDPEQSIMCTIAL